METSWGVLQWKSEETQESGGTVSLVQVACMLVEEVSSKALAGWLVEKQWSWLADDMGDDGT